MEKPQLKRRRGPLNWYIPAEYYKSVFNNRNIPLEDICGK